MTSILRILYAVSADKTLMMSDKYSVAHGKSENKPNTDLPNAFCSIHGSVPTACGLRSSLALVAEAASISEQSLSALQGNERLAASFTQFAQAPLDEGDCRTLLRAIISGVYHCRRSTDSRMIDINQLDVSGLNQHDQSILQLELANPMPLLGFCRMVKHVEMAALVVTVMAMINTAYGSKDQNYLFDTAEALELPGQFVRNTLHCIRLRADEYARVRSVA